MKRETDGVEDELIYSADTIEDLFDFRAEADTLAPALGFIHHLDGQFRLSVVLSSHELPALHDGGPRIGDILYDRINHLACLGGDHIAQLRYHLSHLDLRGWIFTGTAWRVENPWPAREGDLSEHPRRERVYATIYLDHNTGRVTSRMEQLDGTVEHHHVDEPPQGWHPDNTGSIVAAMQILRTTTTTKPTPRKENDG
jgi:hypothetical protein